MFDSLAILTYTTNTASILYKIYSILWYISGTGTPEYYMDQHSGQVYYTPSKEVSPTNQHASRRQERQMKAPPSGGTHYYNLSVESNQPDTHKKPKRSKSFKSFFSKIGKAFSSTGKTKTEFEGNEIDFEEDYVDPNAERRVYNNDSYSNNQSEKELEQQYNENNNYWNLSQGNIDIDKQNVSQNVDPNSPFVPGRVEYGLPQHEYGDNIIPVEPYNDHARGRIFSR